MKRTILAVYDDITGKKVHRRGTLTGQEVEETGASTPSEKVTESTKVMQ
jgi:hypothetical protein